MSIRSTMTMSEKEKIKSVSLDEALCAIRGKAIGLSDELLLIDDSVELDISTTAFRPGFLSICLCTAGTAHFRVDESEADMSRGDLFITIGAPVIRKENASQDFRMKAAMVSQQSVQDSVIGLHQLWPHLDFLYRHPVLKLTEEEALWINHTFDFIFYRFRRTDHRYRNETLGPLIRLFYYDVCELLDVHCDNKKALPPAGYTLFDHFIRLVETNRGTERPIAWYAEQLKISPKYLSETVKRISGRTAGQWIISLAIAEIKNLLADTELSMKEIAGRMNFSNQSQLTKYFRNATGMTPIAFRSNCRKKE